MPASFAMVSAELRSITHHTPLAGPLCPIPFERGLFMQHPVIERNDTIHAGWTALSIATVRYPDGLVIRREVEDHGNAATVLPYDPVRRTALLVTQLRVPVLASGQSEDILEAPAGIVESLDPEACARREVLEECGVRVGVLEPVVTAWSMPGISTERIHLYLAPYSSADRVAAGGGVDHENERITVTEVPLAWLAQAADRGELTDMKTFALLQTLRLRRPELFLASSE
jgi:nudix-type nucleoside diphosphatase (YffH/AdpP family)